MEQNTRMQDLISSLCDEIKMEGPLQGADVLMEAASDDVVGTIDTLSGVHIVLENCVIDFIENCGSAPEKDIASLRDSDFCSCMTITSTLYCDAISGIEALKAERTSANGPASISYPAIIPSD